MKATPDASSKAGKPPLQPNQSIPQTYIPIPLEPTPHHQTVLKVGEDKAIIQRKEGAPPQD